MTTATSIGARLADCSEDVCRLLLPAGHRVGRDWQVGDVSGAPGHSLKICLSGSKAGVWCDFASGDKGDLIGLWRAVRNVDCSTACREALAWLGLPDDHRIPVGPSLRRTSRSSTQYIPPAVSSAVPPEMPPAVAKQWQEGVDYLLARKRLCGRIDDWRTWPVRTAQTLAEDILLGCPLVNGRRTTAFAVHVPYRDEIGTVSTRVVGFHARFRPRDSERASWRYVPNGIGSPPFVIGAGCVESARHVVVLEGPWDAVMFAALAGWLAYESAWPEHVAVFGVRGATTWRSLVDAWLPFMARDARFSLVQDADTAGDAWQTTFVPALNAAGFPVRLLRPRDAKDFSELARTVALNPEELVA